MARRLLSTCLGLLAGLFVGAAPSLAQTYPVKPVSLMVPYPAGGPSDAIARIINGALARELRLPLPAEPELAEPVADADLDAS